MELDLSDYEYAILHEPLECCGGERAVASCTTAVDGRALTVVVIQHALWCGFARIGEA